MEPASTRIAQSLPCLTCGYELRSLTLDERCPECGAPCREAMARLALMDPPALQSLRSGALLAALAIPVAPLVYISLAVISMLAWRSGGSGDVFVLLAVSVIAGPIMAAFGWARLCGLPTAASDAAAGRAQLRSPLAIKFGVAYAVCFSLAALVTAVTILSRRPGMWLGPTGNFIAVTAIGSLWVFRTFLGLRVVTRLAARTGARRTRRSAMLWRWCVLIAFGCFTAACTVHSIVEWVEPGYAYYGASGDSSSQLWRLADAAAQLVMLLAGLLTVGVCGGLFVNLLSLHVVLGREMRLVRSWSGPLLVSEAAQQALSTTSTAPARPPGPASPPAA